jgi:hypothetical protein
VTVGERRSKARQRDEEFERRREEKLEERRKLEGNTALVKGLVSNEVEGQDGDGDVDGMQELTDPAKEAAAVGRGGGTGRGRGRGRGRGEGRGRGRGRGSKIEK